MRIPNALHLLRCVAFPIQANRLETRGATHLRKCNAPDSPVGARYHLAHLRAGMTDALKNGFEIFKPLREIL